MSEGPDRRVIRPPGPVAAPKDLRRMLRDHLARRAVTALEEGAAARRSAMSDAESLRSWSRGIRGAATDMLDLGDLHDAPLNARQVSRYEREHLVIENVLFESVGGWEVNGSVFIPREDLYRPPYPSVIVPCGHSTKTGPHYQLVCQLFARAGFIAITFDTPGQGTEKNAGNDHFTDGPRCYAVGQNAQRYFIADALRAMDYLSTREDVNDSPGFAVTGVSGGGIAAIWTALLDDRVKVCSPTCCATPLKDHPIGDGYACCPEDFPIGRLRLGHDYVDYMAALAPTPQLFMAGEGDEVMTIAMSRAIAAEVQAAYDGANAGEAFDFHAEDYGHAYTLSMARTFVEFAERHWLKEPGRDHAPAFEDNPELEAPGNLMCYPAEKPNMRTLCAKRAATLRAERASSGTVEEAGNAVNTLVPGLASASVEHVARGDRQQVWCSDAEELLFTREQDIFLPATAVWPRSEGPWPAVIMFDDQGRWAALRQGGWLARVSRHLDRDAESTPAVLSIDLRGWGDSRPAETAYDLAAWSGQDRWTSYISASLNDGLMGQRARDGAAVCRWLREQPGIDADRLVLVGHGEGTIVALMVAAALGGVAGVVCIDGPDSIEEIVGAEDHDWSLDVFQPGILNMFDLPELRQAVGPVLSAASRETSWDEKVIEWVWQRT